MNPKTIKLTKDEVWNALDEAIWEEREPFKYNYIKTIVFLHENGSHYMLSIDGSYDDGLTVEDGMTANLATKKIVETWGVE